MKVLVTGAYGFLGKNLTVRLGELDDFEVLPVGRDMGEAELADLVRKADAVCHLAGENRPQDEQQFDAVNRGFTETLADLCAQQDKPLPILFTSSTQATNDSPYGKSKREGEQALEAYAKDTGAPVSIYRLTNIFGKWSKPHYNSVVATFAHNAARGEDLPVNDPDTALWLVYVDDVVKEIVHWLGDCNGAEASAGEAIFGEIDAVYEITVGELAATMRGFAEIPRSLTVPDVGTGLTRALYATYVAFLPTEKASYDLNVHGDARGRFAEILRTSASGQVSFFTAGPGVTRGGHYHHTKTEKFLVVKGTALFRFRHILTDETFELTTDSDHPQVVDTLPGWSHDITNTSDEEMIVVLWANELFEPDRPDTVASTLEAG